MNIRNKLDSCKLRSLSMMGYITLVKSVLSLMPFCVMTDTMISKTCILKMEQMFINFIWGSLGDKQRIHLLS